MFLCFGVQTLYFNTNVHSERKVNLHVLPLKILCQNNDFIHLHFDNNNCPPSDQQLSAQEQRCRARVPTAWRVTLRPAAPQPARAAAGGRDPHRHHLPSPGHHHHPRARTIPLGTHPAWVRARKHPMGEHSKEAVGRAAQRPRAHRYQCGPRTGLQDFGRGGILKMT